MSELNRGIIISFLVLSGINTFCQPPDTAALKPQLIPAWTILVPGASCFYQGNITKGAVFSGLEIGGIYLGIRYNKNLRNNSASPYYNYPLFFGLQVYQTEKLTMFKNRLDNISIHKSDFMYDDMSEKELYLAPFRIKNIVTPITGGMVLLAALFTGIEKHNETRSIREVEKMYLLNRYVDRNQGLAVFGAVSMAMSWNAGVTEEYIFRNYFMPRLDFRYGQKKGLILSSLIFGSAHFTNLLMAEKPDFKSTLLQVGVATLAGYCLGRDVQKRGYDIGPAVAAHTWYDLTLMLGSFLANPENNFLGVNMKFMF